MCHIHIYINVLGILDYHVCRYLATRSELGDNPVKSSIKYNYKWLTLVSALITCIFLILFFYDSHPGQSWKFYQKLYREGIIAAANDSVSRAAAYKIIPEIQHIELKDLNRVDRCITCHRGVVDNSLEKAKLPVRMHSLPYLNDHFISEFGCTICHGGRGRALDTAAAHSQEHADPFLALPGIQSNCGRCHLMIFKSPFDLSGGTLLKDGLQIFQQKGCLGCHKIRGTGGSVGPDLSRQGEKSLEAYNFDHIPGEKSMKLKIGEIEIQAECTKVDTIGIFGILGFRKLE